MVNILKGKKHHGKHSRKIVVKKIRKNIVEQFIFRHFLSVIAAEI